MFSLIQKLISFFFPDKDDHEEHRYLNLVKQILDSEKDLVVGSRGSRTKSIFGHTSRYSLKDGTLPLLTTKKLFVRGIIEELLWMIRGSTDAKDLSDKKVRIWDGHTSVDHHRSVGLDNVYEEGDCGPVYGFQWRHSGAQYINCRQDYRGQGVDQIKAVIESLRHDPGSRRHVVCAWNPSQSAEMVLTPCHCLCQFYIDDNGLSCQLYQRSADVALGVPFNIASYAILTHIIAKSIGVPAYELIHVLGDAHIYEDHLGAIAEQLTRKPKKSFPTLRIGGGELESVCDIERLTFDDFHISDYDPHPSIKMPLVI